MCAEYIQCKHFIMVCILQGYPGIPGNRGVPGPKVLLISFLKVLTLSRVPYKLKLVSL